MSAQFYPIPYAATDACASNHERLVVMDLYERGHSNRWQPFPTTIRTITRQTGARGASVLALLKRLAALGLIRTTPTSTETTIEVADPSTNARFDVAPKRTPEHFPEHENEARGPTVADVRNAHRNGNRYAHARVEDTRAGCEPEPEPEPDHEIVSSRGRDPDDLTNRLLEGTCQALQNDSRPDLGPSLSDADRREVRNVAKFLAWDINDFTLLHEYTHTAGDMAWWRENGKDRWSSMLKNKDEASNRLQAAKAWEARGKVDPVATGPPRGSVRGRNMITILAEEQAVEDEAYGIGKGHS